jgi:Glycosyltransferase family 87
MRLWLTKRRVVTALAVWFVTRVVLYLIATEHLFHHYGVQSVGDVGIYANWVTHGLYYGQIPHTTEWQYPPLLAPILVFPQWLTNTFGIHYLTGFTAMTFAADAVITSMLLWTARRRDTWAGPWYWIVGVPLLGPIVYGRYDVFPALCVVVALALLGQGATVRRSDGTPGRDLNRRRWLAGVLVGLGAAIKIWPAFTVFGMPRTRRGWQAIATVVVSTVVAIASMSLFFTNTMSWVGNQGGRGIEIESVWATPWMLAKGLGLDHFQTNKIVYGSYQIEPDGRGLGSALITVTADVALVSLVLAFAVMAYWWWRRTWRPAVTADATFVATLIFIVASRVISPQYLIWLLAVAGFCLLYKDTTQRRSAVLVLICLPLTQFEFPFDFGSFRNAQIFAVLVVALRNLLLLLATYFGFRDLWVSTVDGPFLTPRTRALLHRPAPSCAPVSGGAAGGGQKGREPVGGRTTAKDPTAAVERGRVAESAAETVGTAKQIEIEPAK